MKKLFFLLLPITLIFSNCMKEEFNPTQQDVPSSHGLLSSQDAPTPQDDDATVAYALECPELRDVDCPFTDLIADELFGVNYGFLGDQSTHGLIDRVINCPYEAYTFCERPCEGEVVLFDGSPGFDFIEIWTGDEPCVEDVYSAPAQQELINKVLQLAIDHAPICSVTNQPMEPVSYNLFWNFFTGNPSGFRIGARIYYTTPCGAIE